MVTFFENFLRIFVELRKCLQEEKFKVKPDFWYKKGLLQENSLWDLILCNALPQDLQLPALELAHFLIENDGKNFKKKIMKKFRFCIKFLHRNHCLVRFGIQVTRL
jgi:hypothetical protein